MRFVIVLAVTWAMTGARRILTVLLDCLSHRVSVSDSGEVRLRT